MPQDLIGCRKRRKLKALIPRVAVFVTDPPWREGSILLSFLLFYGPMVGKYALICAMEIQKIHMVVNIFSGFALFKELMWVYRGVKSLCKLFTAKQGAFWFTNKRVEIKTLSMLQMVWFESLAGNDFSERGAQQEAHCERNLNRQLWSIRRKILHRCSRNFCRHYYKSWWLKVTDLLFASALGKI